MAKGAKKETKMAEQIDSQLPAVAAAAPAVHNVSDEMSVEQLLLRVDKIKDVQKQVMKEGIHYGIIPGTEKPTLYKAGAEILAMTFKLDAQFSHEKEFDGEHLTVYSTCTLYSINSGVRVGSGKACCSTKEDKYAWRHGARKCPVCGKEAIIKGKEEYGGGYICWVKKDGCGAKFRDGDPTIESQSVGKVANDKIADCYNTVLKMSDIRAHRAAILFATAASDAFTQDIGEVDDPSMNPVESKRAEPEQAKNSYEREKELFRDQPQPLPGQPPPQGLKQPQYGLTQPKQLSKAHIDLRDGINQYIKDNPDSSLTGEAAFAEILKVLTQYDSYYHKIQPCPECGGKKCDKCGKTGKRLVPGNKGVSTLEACSDAMAGAALRRFRERLAERKRQEEEEARLAAGEK